MPAQLAPGRGFVRGQGPPRLAPTRESTPAPGPVMGDPTTVAEDESIGYASEQYQDDDPEPLWLKLPDELSAWFDLGFVHTDECCPYVVMRARDDTARGQIEISGPPSAFLGLAQVIATLCESVPCLSHAARGEAAQREAG